MAWFDPNTLLALLSVVIAAIGTLLVFVTVFEYTRLLRLRKEFETLRAELEATATRGQKALHRVVASYGLRDPAARIALLKSAAQIDPKAFNVYNALGFAHLDQGDTAAAIEAFHHAVRQHPDDKAGYFDLAWAYQKQGNAEAAAEELRQAIAADPTARDDLRTDGRFAALRERVL